MQVRIKQIGLSLGVAAVFAVGYLGTSGQYVPPVNRANQVATSSRCSTGERPEWDGSAWQCRTLNDLRSKHLEFSHDFLAAQQSDWLGNSTSGTGASVSSQSTTTRPGITDLQTGTTTTGFARWNGASATGWRFSNYSTLMFEVVGGWPTLSTVSEEYASVIGFGDSASAINQSNGCYFLEDRLPVATAPNTGTITAGSTNLQCWCANGGTRTGYTMDGSIVSQESFTTVNTPVAALTLPDTNIYRMRIVVTPGTRAEFYVDSGAGLIKRCDINTNVPTTNGVNHVFSIIKSAGTTSRSMYVDWAHLAADMLAARSL